MWRPIFLAVLLLTCTVAIVHAQSDDCPAAITRALEPVGERCNPLDRNSACYGESQVESTTFDDPRPADFFAAPGDRAELIMLREIHPQPLDEATGNFGVAVLNIQANIPNTIPGQAVLFLLMGDARLTNEVPVDSTDETPFQSFYFLPGIGESRCYESEPILTIQTPGNITVTINFNGVDTEFAPGTLLTITPAVCTIHRGSIIQRVGDETAVLLANQTVDIFIDDEGRINVTNLRGISEREYQRGLQVQSVLNTLATTNGWQEQFLTEPRKYDVEPGQAPSTCTTEHTVVSGETMHRIARIYNTSAQSIVDANNLEDPRLIVVGQKLCIPNPGSGFEPLPSS